MKKLLISVIALTSLVGCGAYYDYYKGGVRYTQDGRDCIYYAGERGRDFSDDVDGMSASKKIVYRNTRCEDLYAADNFGRKPCRDCKASVKVVENQPCAAKCQSKCGCEKSVTPVLRRTYFLMPVM